MKKLLVMLLAGYMLFSLTGCSSDNETNNDDGRGEVNIEENADIGTDSSEEPSKTVDFEVLIGDVSLSFPCSYGDAIDTIIDVTDGYVYEFSVEPNSQQTVEVVRKDDRTFDYFILVLENNSDKELDFKDCSIVGIIQSEDLIGDDGVLVTFPGDLKVNDKCSEDMLIQMYGEPTSNLDIGYGLKVLSWSYEDNKEWGQLSVYLDMEEGKVYRIDRVLNR